MTGEQTSPNGQLLTPEQLEQAKTYIFQQLPKVLAQSPEFVTFVEGIVAEKFPRRDEFARLLDALEAHRRETRARDVIVDKHFAQVDKRFEQMDRHLAQVDKRLDQMDEHLAQVDKRLDQMDEHLAQVDKRLEQVDRRFEQVDRRFEQVDKRFDQMDGRMDSMEKTMQDGFLEVHKSIDRLGARWGIRNEKVFRKTMRTLFEESFGVKVEERHIGGEQYDVVIHNGDHILIEIAASVGPKMQERLVRKRQKYIAETGVTPTRSILAVGSVSRKRGAALEALGFEVVEPDDDYEE